MLLHGLDQLLICCLNVHDEVVMETKTFVFRFADFEVREDDFALVKPGEWLAVEPKAFPLLLLLLRNPRKLLRKDEFLDTVWSDTAVTENSLTRSIALLRHLLGDDARDPRFIETVATVGYRFICPIEAMEQPAAAEAESRTVPGEHIASLAMQGTAAGAAPAPLPPTILPTPPNVSAFFQRRRLAAWLCAVAVCIALAAVTYLKRHIS